MGPRRVAAPPDKPLLIFDGDCGFCRRWIARWRRATGDAVRYATSQETAARFPEIPKEAFERSVQFVTPAGEVFEGAEAALRALAQGEGAGRLLRAYRVIPGFAPAAELFYGLIARHRRAASAATRWLWGGNVEKPTYRISSDLFLRSIGLCYFAAFLSLFVQVAGLVGTRGILPAGEFLSAVRSQTGGERYWLLPTLCWLDSSDGFLKLLCGGGAAAALLAVAGLLPAWALAFSWVSYLSLSAAGQVFLEFQWDALLLEAGLLAVFLAPRGVRLTRAKAPPSPAVLFLLRWLLFRLMFSSGFVKLASGDPNWRHLTALRYHYETQPLPPWTAWFMHQLPGWFQTLSCAVMFAIELGAPFLVFAPRRLRLLSCGTLLFLQAVIAATGNYAFFNLLAIALCVLLLDDAAFPERWRERRKDGRETLERRWPRWIVGPVAAVILLVSGVLTASMLDRAPRLPPALVQIVRLVVPFRSVNTYGLFAVMTTSRPEIVVEGSDDLVRWRAYEFRWKPGDVSRRPRFVAPHQPRLDWQMWFAALGSYEENPWFIRFLARLLEGSPEVLGLLRTNPFPGHPPRYVRAVLYDYRFTDPAQRRSTGDWWRREKKGLYCPVLSRDMLRSQRGVPRSALVLPSAAGGRPDYTPKRSASHFKPSSPGGAM